MTTAATHRSEGAPNPDDASWLVLRLADGSELWTSCAALRRIGMPPSAVAAILVRKFKLANPKKARPLEALAALSVLILPANAIIHEGGNA